MLDVRVKEKDDCFLIDHAKYTSYFFKKSSFLNLDLKHSIQTMIMSLKSLGQAGLLLQGTIVKSSVASQKQQHVWMSLHILVVCNDFETKDKEKKGG